MAEFWTTRDANGAYLKDLFTSREFAEGVVFVANRSKLGYFPHEVVHLVEAGTVEPELAEVVKAVHDYLRDECFNMEPVDRAFCALKPHQLRDCGIEVDDG